MHLSTPMKYFALTIGLLVAASGAAFGGLRDISPRPQQMGYLSTDPIPIYGSLYIVVPTAPTQQEAIVRDSAVALIERLTFRRPTVVYTNNMNGRYPALWIGTAARFSQLVNALDSTTIQGMGQLTHTEEYQIYTTPNRILLCGSDTRALRWGLQSLSALISEIYGTVYVENVYIRDWPKFPKRITVINNSIRDQDQTDFCNWIVDHGYDDRYNEIEWNNGDAGGNPMGRPNVIQAALDLAAKIKRNGMFLTMSCDRTGVEVYDQSWQEGIPVEGSKYRVGTTTMTPIPGGFNVSIPNSNFEQWVGNRPTRWYNNPPECAAFVFRDQINRHGGTSSVKWTGFTNPLPGSTELIQDSIFVGHHRWLRTRMWYKMDNFSGRLRFKVFGPEPVETGCDFRELIVENYTCGWTEWVMDFTTYNIDSVRVLVGPDVATGGTVWVDDVTWETAPAYEMLRRPDTPVEVRKLPSNQLMLEGYDYQIADASGQNYFRYVEIADFQPLAGGRLFNNDSVSVNWFCAVPYHGGRQTPCWSLLDPIVNYQDRVRNLDSLLRPDGFKIHINEVSFAGYDPLCTASGLSPGQLVGRYCRRMYDMIQQRRPGAFVRIYGDPFDIWVDDPRAMPIAVLPWTAGALQELPSPVEMMNMASYTDNVDSSFAYFAANGHPAILALDGYQAQENQGFDLNVNSMIKAYNTPSCAGVMYYDYFMDYFQRFQRDVGKMAWNLGPYIVHTPIQLEAGQTNVTFEAEMWSDTFQQSSSPSITQRIVRYRMLPGTTWQQATLAPNGTDHFITTLTIPGGTTGIEYYLSATDHRAMTHLCPVDAPSTTFLVMFPSMPPPIMNPPRAQLEFTTTLIGTTPLIEWQPLGGIKYYEVRLAENGETEPRQMRVIATLSAESPRYLFAGATVQNVNPEDVRVYAVFESGRKR